MWGSPLILRDVEVCLPEDQLIKRWLLPLASACSSSGLTDDCCRLVCPEKYDLLVNVDALSEGIHFFAGDPWDLVARKALRVNISDLIAKGAKPFGYMFSLSLPTDWTEEAMDSLTMGLAIDQSEFGLILLGGDTITSVSGLTLAVTMFGLVPSFRVIPSRGNAKSGDIIYVSGTIGDAAIGLNLRKKQLHLDSNKLSDESIEYFLNRYLLPQPRVTLASVLLEYASAAMDVSDGFLVDMSRLCSASNLSAKVNVDVLPLSWHANMALELYPELIKNILTGGDDYELLFTVPKVRSAAFEEAAILLKESVTKVGEMLDKGTSPVLLYTERRSREAYFHECLKDPGYRHF